MKIFEIYKLSKQLVDRNLAYFHMIFFRCMQNIEKNIIGSILNRL